MTPPFNYYCAPPEQVGASSCLYLLLPFHPAPFSPPHPSYLCISNQSRSSGQRDDALAEPQGCKERTSYPLPHLSRTCSYGADSPHSGWCLLPSKVLLPYQCICGGSNYHSSILLRFSLLLQKFSVGLHLKVISYLCCIIYLNMNSLLQDIEGAKVGFIWCQAL